jgi:hypothetical protein
MTRSATRTRPTIGWLCAAIALLLVLVPAAGVTVCVGHDGHVGVGVKTATRSCPCGHEEADAHAGRGERELPVPGTAVRHPPCEDFELSAPAFVRGDHGPHLPALVRDATTVVLPWPFAPPATVADAAGRQLPARWAEPRPRRPRRLLAERATTLLLL